MKAQKVALAVLAGGMGTRLFGQDGGSKAMVWVGQWRLIDYVLSEAQAVGVTAPTVVVREGDDSLTEYVQAVGGKAISAPPTGTGAAVAALLEATNATPAVLLSTCDIWGPPGAISDFIRRASTMLEDRPSATPLCILAVEPPPLDDDTPIWVECKGGVVRAYGKALEPTGMAFAGVRLLNNSFARLWLQAWAANPHGTDTTTTSSVLDHNAGSLAAIYTEGVFDVDTPIGRERAENIGHQ